MMALEGGSFGLEIGGEATDFVLLVMNERGARGILTSKVKLGADASVAAGPVGRTASAETDASLRADILSYSRARGAFAGVSLEDQPFVLIMVRINRSMDRKFLRSRLC
jgi:lipid-binding SYLF domain-containing protein